MRPSKAQRGRRGKKAITDRRRRELVKGIDVASQPPRTTLEGKSTKHAMQAMKQDNRHTQGCWIRSTKCARDKSEAGDRSRAKSRSKSRLSGGNENEGEGRAQAGRDQVGGQEDQQSRSRGGHNSFVTTQPMASTSQGRMLKGRGGETKNQKEESHGKTNRRVFKVV